MCAEKPDPDAKYTSGSNDSTKCQEMITGTGKINLDSGATSSEGEGVPDTATPISKKTPVKRVPKKNDTFWIYAFTLPQVLNPPDGPPHSPKLVKVGITMEVLSTRLNNLNRNLRNVCGEEYYLINAECDEMLIRAQISVGWPVSDKDIQVTNPEAVTRSMLGHPATLAYVGRKLKRKIGERNAYEFSTALKEITEGCGFTEWVVCSHQKIEALKRDIKTEKILSKEEVHESGTAFLMRLKIVLENPNLLLE